MRIPIALRRVTIIAVVMDVRLPPSGDDTDAASFGIGGKFWLRHRRVMWTATRRRGAVFEIFAPGGFAR